MFGTRSNRTTSRVLQVAFAAIAMLVWCAEAQAQEPPLDVPGGTSLFKSPDVTAIDGWLLYPQLGVFSLYSDNLFMSPTNPIHAVGFGIAPGLTAQWTNGIHTTTLYGNVQGQVFPTETEINTLDGKAGITQRYEPLRDLIFTVNGDYTHQTIAPSLTSAIPNPVASPGPVVLPNGNIQLPNGTIVSPTGTLVGQATPALNVIGTSLVNPYDVFTGTATVDKYFNRGVVSLSTSFARTEYEQPGTADFSTRSFRGSGAFWLGPVFYVYSDGSVANTTFSANGSGPAAAASPDSTAFRAVGGIGFRTSPLFGGSAYYGRQGSESPGIAGGNVYGARLAFNPTPIWSMSVAVDETINETSNVVQQSSPPSMLALALPQATPLLISETTGTRISSISFQSTYILSPDLTLSGHFGYTRAQYIGSSQLDNTWLADVMLAYALTRNMTLTWDYQWSSIASNVPLTSTKRNYVNMGAVYKF